MVNSPARPAPHKMPGMVIKEFERRLLTHGEFPLHLDPPEPKPLTSGNILHSNFAGRFVVRFKPGTPEAVLERAKEWAEKLVAELEQKIPENERQPEHALNVDDFGASIRVTYWLRTNPAKPQKTAATVAPKKTEKPKQDSLGGEGLAERHLKELAAENGRVSHWYNHPNGEVLTGSLSIIKDQSGNPTPKKQGSLRFTLTGSRRGEIHSGEYAGFRPDKSLKEILTELMQRHQG